MKKIILLFFSLVFFGFNLNAQTLNSVSETEIQKNTYTASIVYGTGTDFYSYTLIFITNGIDTIYPSYTYPISATEIELEFYPTCNKSDGLYDLYITTLTDGNMMLANAFNIYVDLNVDVYAYDPKCNNDANGSIEVDAWGGRGGPSFAYLWNTGATSYYIGSLPAGNYWCKITDLYDFCVDTIFVTLDNPPVFNLYWTEIDANCGQNDGIAWIDSITGGIPPYYQFWGPSETSTDTISNLSLGAYSLMVEDNNGCIIHHNFNITERISSSVSTVNTTCGVAGGSATITPLNGTGPFTVLWSNGDTGFTADSLLPGIYSATITDGTCSGTEYVTITGTDGPVVTSVVTGSPTCTGLQNGSINITVSGGTAPYTFGWSNGSTTEDLTNVPAGIYELNITDAGGCFVAQCISISEQLQLTIDNYYTYDPDCGFNNGTIDLYIYGGVAPYTVDWSANASGQTGSYIYDLLPGIYTATVTDAQGCAVTMDVPLSDYFGPYSSYDSDIPADCGQGNGSVYTTSCCGNGGPYTWSWSDGSTNESLENVEPGQYFVTITDVSGCKGVYPFYVSGNPPTSGQDICIVTVDSLTNSNLVVWEKAVATNIDYYNIYREACGNIEGFVWVGSVPYDSLSQFVDYGANPMVKSWRYIMTSVNDCGAESDVSPLHKTIHLTATRQGLNNVHVVWDDYTGFSYTEQYLWRYHSSTNWVIIDTLSFGVNYFLDNSVLATDSVQYFIEAYPSFTCTSTRAENHNSTRSNRGTLAPPAVDFINENGMLSNLLAYPNPSNGDFNLNFLVNEAGTASVQVYDVTGRIVVNHPLNVTYGSNNHVLNMTAAANGIYYVKIQLGTVIYQTKIIKN